MTFFSISLAMIFFAGALPVRFESAGANRRQFQKNSKTTGANRCNNSGMIKVMVQILFTFSKKPKPKNRFFFGARSAIFFRLLKTFKIAGRF